MFIYCVSYPKLVFINTGYSACKQTLLQHAGGRWEWRNEEAEGRHKMKKDGEGGKGG